ncbi:hypothetical protein [Streptomyces sp. NRRL B-24484]|uniref:hypothetical protein n=1 Tax=Streptomyces sp. NRRL B-24484 TaxID=1463833 RepID=UPI0004BFB030|nr:hypothetical protein [Streptomyces sp. NRRL B-24484]
MGWELDVTHEESVPVGLDGGRSSVGVVPPGPGWPARGPVLRLVMPLARPVVRVRRIRTAADGTRTCTELTPTVRTGRQCVLEYPLDPPGGEAAVRFELDWEVRRAADRRETPGDEQLLTRIHLVAPSSDGEDQLLASTLLRLAWCDPGDREPLDLLLLRAAADEALPATVRAALAELAEADRAAVPSCAYCALRWELRLLDAADRARAAVRGRARLAALLELLDTSTAGRTHRRPCDCRRQNPGRTGLAPEVPEDELRHALTAARARHLAHRTAPPPA